jgi:hypothetical protein
LCRWWLVLCFTPLPVFSSTGNRSVVILYAVVN